LTLDDIEGYSTATETAGIGCSASSLATAGLSCSNRYNG